MTTENPLQINDLFWTFQGEGYHAGRRALFVRLPFCNLSCSWCDTTFNTFEKWSEKDFVAFAHAEPGRFAVVTGGEPMMNKNAPRVVALLRSLGFTVAVESNGTFPLNAPYDFITVSPKKFSEEKNLEPYFIHPELFHLVDEFKYVVDKDFDFSILDRHVGIKPRYSLSPEFNDFKKNLDRISKYIAIHPHWRVSLQTHKWMEIK